MASVALAAAGIEAVRLTLAEDVSSAGFPWGEQPGLEQVVELLARDPLGEADELRVSSRPRRLRDCAHVRRIRKKSSSPTASRSCVQGHRAAEVDRDVEQQVRSGVADR